MHAASLIAIKVADCGQSAFSGKSKEADFGAAPAATNDHNARASDEGAMTMLPAPPVATTIQIIPEALGRSPRGEFVKEAGSLVECCKDPQIGDFPSAIVHYYRSNFYRVDQ